jgi:ribosomal protein S18 acetylase RimI-like enzyme
VTDSRRSLRRATAGDALFITAMLAEAASWERAPSERPYPLDHLLAISEIADYVRDWGRAGDAGVVAEVDGAPAGACWYRLFTAEHPGYGFIAGDIPGLGIGVDPSWRGQGIGRALLASTVATAREQGHPALGLSVSERNRVARRLYKRVGFVVVRREGDGLTMRLDLAGDEAGEGEL